jgi:hypothetical protein
MKRAALAAIFALAVASAEAGPAPAPNPLQRFTVNDLKAALADAQAHGDTRHAQCWEAAIPIAEQWQIPVKPPSAPGLASLAQLYFDAQALRGQPLVPDSLVTACALTTYDLRIALAEFAALLGVQAIPLPHLPPIVPALPPLLSNR